MTATDLRRAVKYGYRIVGPGEACQPRDRLRVIDGLTDGEKDAVLSNLFIYAPEAFENALSLVSSARDRRRRLAAEDARLRVRATEARQAWVHGLITWAELDQDWFAALAAHEARVRELRAGEQ